MEKEKTENNKLPLKYRTAIAAILVVAFVGILVKRSLPKYKEVEIEGKIYQLEVVDTPAERAKGLMGRKNLGENEGMLFVFQEEKKHTFWMYKTLIPLTMIWLDKEWNVVHIEENVPPCKEENPLRCPSYAPPYPAKYVIEISPR